MDVCSCSQKHFLKQESSVEDLQDLGQIEMPEDQEEHSEEKGDEPQGERHFVNKQWLPLFM